MISFNQGDVVLIPFPFTDLSSIKQRPAVVLSTHRFNLSHRDLIVAAITSHIPEVIEVEDYLLNEDDLKTAKLPKQSLVKTGKIVTIDKHLIRKRLGHFPKNSIEHVKARFIKYIF